VSTSRILQIGKTYAAALPDLSIIEARTNENLNIVGLGLNAKLTMLSQYIGHVAQKVNGMAVVVNSSISAQANDSAAASTALNAIKTHLVDDRIIIIALAVVATASR